MSEDQKKILESQLWGIANLLRGKISADDYRDYILGFIFYKYLSEKQTIYANELLVGEPVTDYKKVTNKETLNAIKEESLLKLGYFLEPSQLFSVLAAKGNADTESESNYILEDLKAVLNHIEQSTMGTESEEDFNALFEDLDLNSTKIGRTVGARNEIIVKILTHLDKIDFRLDEIDSDVLGDAYEYLIAKFAAGAGKSAGEFYTPQQVSKILAKIVTTEKTKIKSVYDPTCGSGSLLLRVSKEADVSEFYGQELNRTTYNLARMNMILHDVHFREFNIMQEDTLENPQHLDKRFEAVVANPPFSAHWKGDANPLFGTDDRFSQYGRLAPKTKADFAFITHMIYHLSDNGVMACIVPHGALYRGGAEKTIRKYLIKELNYLDAVIGLPGNLFYGTDIETCILVFKKCREQNEDVLFIDGSNEYQKDDKQNILLDDHIDNIYQVFKNRNEIPRYSHKASLQEIEENDYYLNIYRYVKQIEKETLIDPNSQASLFQNIYKEITDVDLAINEQCIQLGIDSPFLADQTRNLITGNICFKKDDGKPFGDWEKIHLNKILTERKERNYNNEYTEVFSVAKDKGVINQIEHLGRSYASDDLTNYKVVKPNDIVYTKSPTADFPYGIIKQNKTGRTGVVSVLYAVFEPKTPEMGLLLDIYFSSWVNTLNYLKPIINKGAKNTININNDVFLRGAKIPLPSDTEECIKITDFLLLLDKRLDLIEAQKTIFSHYKKGILQKLFL